MNFYGRIRPKGSDLSGSESATLHESFQNEAEYRDRSGQDEVEHKTADEPQEFVEEDFLTLDEVCIIFFIAHSGDLKFDHPKS